MQNTADYNANTAFYKHEDKVLAVRRLQTTHDKLQKRYKITVSTISTAQPVILLTMSASTTAHNNHKAILLGFEPA